MIRAVLRLLFGCRHPQGLIRESRDGVRIFTCHSCGYWAPQIQRTTAERRKLLKQIASRPVVTRQTADKIRRIR